MNITDITTMISTIGFPIVACAYLAHFQNTTIKELSDTITRNTIVLEKLQTRLSKEGDSDEDK